MLLRPKIALLILPVILLQILVVIVPSYILYQQNFTQQIKNHISDSIVQAENALHVQLNAIQADSLIFSQSALLNRYLSVEDKNIRFNLMHGLLLDEFSTFMSAHPEYLEISLLMPDGYEEVSLRNKNIENLNRSKKNTQYFQNIVKSPVDVEISPMINPDNNQWSLILSRKVFQKNPVEQTLVNDDILKAYLIIKVNLGSIKNHFKHNELIRDGFVAIHNNSGEDIFTKGVNNTSSRALFKIFSSIGNSEKLHVLDWSFNDNSYIIGQKKLFDDFFFTIGWSTDELQLLLNNISITTLKNALIAMILSAFILFWALNRLLVKRIRQLSLSAKIMGLGGALWPFESKSNDELNELAITVKNMGSNLIKQKQKIHEFAFIDSLTKLPNRRQFTNDLDRQYSICKEASPDISLFFIDLDGFKQVNDTCGHQAGDALLITVAQRFKSVLRNTDSISYASQQSALTQHKVARLGGDEFTILLHGIKDREQVATVAKRLLGSLNRPIEIASSEFLISASIGIAIAAECGESAVDLLKNADAAMYEAKDMGKNTYRFFNKSAAMRSLQALEMQRELRCAIKNNELQLAYQPQVCSKTQTMIGCEALVRWHQPGKGWIPPDVFIPIAEESGLIVALGRWVILQACQQIKQWQLMGCLSVPVWVNISCVQLAKENMHQVILDCLAETGVSREQLAVEVTESSIMQGTDSIMQLEKIQAEGIKIALDDFGTGYSSLSALRGLPIDELKIDKSFITDLASGENGKAIVSAIIAMAHQLNLKVVAEGVETSTELDFLTDNGADIIQGYYFSKPLLSKDFIERLQPPAENADNYLEKSSFA